MVKWRRGGFLKRVVESVIPRLPRYSILESMKY